MALRLISRSLWIRPGTGLTALRFWMLPHIFRRKSKSWRSSASPFPSDAVRTIRPHPAGLICWMISEALPLALVFNPPGYPDVVHHGHENQVAAGKGDVGGDPGALGARGSLDT